MPFELVRNDITKMRTDAIVNAANSSLAAGGGVCGAIYAAAGFEDMSRACRAIGRCDVGSAVITDGFALPARHVIHTVGPIYHGGAENEAQLLRSCYLESLALAQRSRCRSIAFPLISAGIYGYPKAEALSIAVAAIRDFLAQHEMQVYLVLFDRDAAVLGARLPVRLRAYIDDHYADARAVRRAPNEQAAYRRQCAEQAAAAAAPAPLHGMLCPAQPARTLRERLSRLDDSFSDMLLRLIDEKGFTDVEVYKRANIDRKLFSKLRKPGYNPSKQTAIALSVALRLNLDETLDLLGRAGYTLSRSSRFDVIVSYFIESGSYDIYEINEALFCFDEKLLGA